MDFSINSGAKIKLISGLNDQFGECQANRASSFADIRKAVDSMATRGTDVAFNELVAATNMMDNIIGSVSKVFIEVNTVLSRATTVGPELVSAANKLMPALEQTLNQCTQFSPISKAVMDQRGLEDSYTPEKAAALVDAIGRHDKARLTFITALHDGKAQASACAFDEVYTVIGRMIETNTNLVADAINNAYSQLEEMGIDVTSLRANEKVAMANIATLDAPAKRSLKDAIETNL